MNLDKQTEAFMHLHMNLEDGRVYHLKVPTFWDSVENHWMGALHLPNSKRFIKATGKDSFELQNNFNVELSKEFKNNEEEIFSLFTLKEERS